MKNLILSSHLEVIKESIEKIQQGLESLEALQTQQHNLQTIHQDVKDIKAKIKNLKYWSGNNKNFVTSFVDPNNISNLDIYEQALSVSAKLSQEITQVEEKFNNVSIFFESNSTQREQIINWLRTIKNTEVIKTTEELINELDTLSSKIKQSPGSKLSKKIQSQIKKIDDRSQILFDEYIEFFGGLAMRGSRFYSEICEFADDLIDEIKKQRYVTSQKYTNHSLIIPARKEAMEQTLARLVRLGFPEWTVWSLPLVIAEFGHILVKNSGEINSFKEAQITNLEAAQLTKREKEVKKICLHYLIADALATFNLGPSYACATILLRLNSLYTQRNKNNLSKRNKDLISNKRCHIILTMLREMNKGTVDEMAYIEFIEKLGSAWSEYLWQTDIEELNDTEKDKNEQLAKSLMPIFSRLLFTRYSEKEWNIIKDDIEKILQPKYATSPFCKRHILNYAWYKRLQGDDDGGRAPQNISIETVELWHATNNKKAIVKRGEKSRENRIFKKSTFS